jgi:glutamyl-tRNA synthetase
MTVRGRFAPSPTGQVHLGTARTALLAWRSARRQGGAFVLRIEDLDGPRVVPGAAAAIRDDLRGLGRDGDEGPDVGGPHGPYRQSERGAHYEAALRQLDGGDRLVRCFCSRKQLALASAPHAGEDGPPYPGTCRGLGADEIARRSRERPPALRFRVAPGIVNFLDREVGPVQEDVEATVGDFVLRRADGVHAYQLAVVVDDLAMGITEVVRGADLLASTARQIQLYGALGAVPPSWHHVPLVLDEAGARLAKRHHTAVLAHRRASGQRPADVIGELAASAGIHPRGSGPISARELL